MKVTDNVGVISYYWGASSSPSSSSYTSITSTTSKTITKTVSSAGTYYLIAKDAAGNTSALASVTFYKTTLNGNGGNVSPNYVISKSSTSFILPSATRSGYTFLGWAKSSSATSASYSAGASFSPNSNLSLYAVWKKSFYGDLNHDGVVNSADSTILSEIIVGKKTADSLITLKGDLNGDGKLTQTDCLILAQYCEKLTDEFPVEDMFGLVSITMQKTDYKTGESIKVDTFNVTYTNYVQHKVKTGFTYTPVKASGTGQQIVTATLGEWSAIMAIQVSDNSTNSGAVVTIASVSTQANKTIDVTVDITKAAPLCFMRFTLNYDTSVLKLDSVTNGELFDTFDQGTSLMFSRDNNINKTGRLMTLRFTVVNNAPDGTYNITLNCREAYNYNEQDVSVAVNNGSVTVTNCILGDVNDDGKVDGKDLVRLRKYVSNYNEATGSSSIVISSAGDVTGDNIVNGKDLVRLRKYLANYNEITGESTVVLG